MFNIFVFFAILASLASVSQSVYVLDCTGAGAGTPQPANVIIPSCQRAPCILKKGETYTIEIDFEIDHETNLLKTRVDGILGGVTLPWNGVGPDGCSALTIGSCPLKAWDYVTYSVELFVQQIYPTTPLTIKWQIMDDNEVPIFCFHLPAEIVP